MKTLCIYHGNCVDGFGAAWAVRRALGDSVEFHAGVYQNPPPDVTGRDVLMVDFSYKAATVYEMAAKASTLVILDHHKSAAEDLADLPPPIDGPYDPNAMLHWQRECNAPTSLHALFDMERSGAGITWDYLHPGKARPVLIDHIEDRDLWRFALPKTREIQAAVFSYPYDFEIWDKLMDGSPDHLFAEGCAIERKHFKDIDELVKVTRRTMLIGGYAVPVANLPYTLSSDAGHKMAQGERFAACYWDVSEGRVFSLRSTDDGMDVSAIAKQYGGGGHAHAAGFRVPFDQLGQFDYPAAT
jgi:oligoribonuclease NrnB/cAMP/cGMP phosphodiesterase (DHH superfamily)